MSASPSFGGPTPLWTGRQGRTNNLVVTRLCCDDLSQVMETTGPQLWPHRPTPGSSNNYGCLCFAPRDWPCRLRCGQGAGALRAPM